MRSRNLKRYKDEEGIDKAMEAMGVKTPQAVYHAINIGRDIQVIEQGGLIACKENRMIHSYRPVRRVS